jgi:S-(hydroxymethyl)glutathione dehydrogenase/alcohol dehydrogenase
VAPFGVNGAVGLSVVQGARIAGAARIVAVDPVKHKRDTAGARGATETVDPSVGSVVEAVRELTGGRWVDFAFEAVGSAQASMQALAMTRCGGMFIMVGAPPPDHRLDLNASDLPFEQKVITSSRAGSLRAARDIPQLVALAETGRLDLASMVTRLDSMTDEGLHRAMRAIETAEVVRTVLVPAIPLRPHHLPR